MNNVYNRESVSIKMKKKLTLRFRPKGNALFKGL